MDNIMNMINSMNIFKTNKNTTSKNESEGENEIDKKKNKSLTTSAETINWSDFFKSIFSFLFQLIIVFIIGSRIVIACKYAQANLLPTNGECMPYSDIEPEFESKEPLLNIDKTKIYNKEANTTLLYAKTIVFPFTKSTTSNYFIDILRKMGEKYNVSGLKKFIIEVIKTMFCWNFVLFSGLLNIFNWIPFETLIILFGPFLLRYYLIFGTTFLGFIITLVACIFNMGWLFKKNTNNDQGASIDMDGPPKWANINMLTDLFEFMGVVFNLIGGAIILGMFMVLPVHLIVFIICFITPFLQTPKIVIDPTDPSSSKRKDYSFMQSVKGLFETKIDIFMIIICMQIVNSAHKYTNAVATGFIAFACIIFIYWSYTRPKTVPQFSSTFVASDAVNGKKCNVPTSNEPADLEEEPQVAQEIYVKPKPRKTKLNANDTKPFDITDRHPELQMKEPTIVSQPEGTTETEPLTTEPLTTEPLTTEPLTTEPELEGKETPIQANVNPNNFPPLQKGGRSSIIEERKALLERKIKMLKSTMKHQRTRNV